MVRDAPAPLAPRRASARRGRVEQGARHAGWRRASRIRHAYQRRRLSSRGSARLSRGLRGHAPRSHLLQLSVLREINWPSCADPSPLASLLVAHIPPVCSLLAPSTRGASTQEADQFISRRTPTAARGRGRRRLPARVCSGAVTVPAPEVDAAARVLHAGGWPRRATLGVLALSAALYAGQALARYGAFHQHTFDLALYSRMAWGLAQGNFWDPILGAHVFG
ncbi:hypothetical protein GW813_07555, partial [bacterium]|nr:hypothetical protein [bacterium]